MTAKAGLQRTLRPTVAMRKTCKSCCLARADPLWRTGAAVDGRWTCKTPRGLLEARPAGLKGLEGREMCLQPLQR